MTGQDQQTGLAAFLRQRRELLEIAWERVRAETVDPHATEMRHLLCMLSIREQLRNIDSVIGPKPYDAQKEVCRKQ